VNEEHDPVKTLLGLKMIRDDECLPGFPGLEAKMQSKDYANQ
jgi:hypothetical protein